MLNTLSWEARGGGGNFFAEISCSSCAAHPGTGTKGGIDLQMCRTWVSSLSCLSKPPL